MVSRVRTRVQAQPADPEIPGYDSLHNSPPNGTFSPVSVSDNGLSCRPASRRHLYPPYLLPLPPLSFAESSFLAAFFASSSFRSGFPIGSCERLPSARTE